jgi:hypothetical protein
VRIPPGVHKIDFKFHPSKFYTGNTIAGISSILLYALLIGAIVFAFRNKGQQEEPEETKKAA